MPGKPGKGGKSSGKARKGSREQRAKQARRVVSEGVRVRAVKADSGRAATAVDVEVEPDRIRREVGEFKDVQEVVAQIPAVPRGERDVRWQEQRLDKIKEEVRGPGERTVRYSTTHYGASEADRYGVGVRVKTDAGEFETPRPGAVRDAGKPRSEETIKPPEE